MCVCLCVIALLLRGIQTVTVDNSIGHFMFIHLAMNFLFVHVPTDESSMMFHSAEIPTWIPRAHMLMLHFCG